MMEISPKTGCVELGISDHLDWTQEAEHLVLLQEKVNAYLRFIESGELLKHFPEAMDRGVRITVVARHSIPSNAQSFYEELRKTLEQAGYGYGHEVLKHA